MNLSTNCNGESTAAEQFQRLLNEHDVARITGMSLATVRRWRLLGHGPKYIKIGAAVRYSADSVTAFLGSCPSAGGQGIAR